MVRVRNQENPHIYNIESAFRHSGSGSVGSESACNAGNQGSNPGVGRSSGEGNGNPL